MLDTAHPKILLVDDEPNVLDALTRQLRRQFAVITAGGGAAGLEAITRDGPFAVVVSDMRMPGMDGSAFLGRARETAPDTVRILLTGQADLSAAIAVVNHGQVFRFLTKPCAPEVLSRALADAVEQHRLVTAERVLLEQTLHGSIKALTEILALASPTAFGRATRAKQRVGSLAEKLEVAERWQIEVAAMLSQVGCITLPAETAEKIYHAKPLSPREQEMADRLPSVAGELLASIPRIEEVQRIVAWQAKHFDGGGIPAGTLRGEAIPWGARALKIVLDYDALEAQGLVPQVALGTLKSRAGWYDPAILDAFIEMLDGGSRGPEIREVRLRDVHPGMVFARDVVTHSGMLLIARGQEVTPGLIQRIRNFPQNAAVKEPVLVILAARGDYASEPTDRSAG